MPNPETFRRAQFQSDLLLFRTFAQSSGLLAENAMSAMLCFSLVATRFVDDFEQDPDTNPYEMLLQAGEARARVEAVVGELESALEHLRRLPLRLDPDGVNPDEEEPEADETDPEEGEPGSPATAVAPSAAPSTEASAIPASPPRRRKRGQQTRSARPQAPATGTGPNGVEAARVTGAEPEPAAEPADGTERAPDGEADPEDSHD